MPAGIGLEARQIDDGELGLEGGQLGGRRAAQQIANEERVPGELGENARPQPMRGIGTGKKVLHVQLASLSMTAEIGQEQIELGGRQRLVIFPPHAILGRRVANDELVLHGATGVGAGIDDKRTARRETALAPANRQLDQAGFAKVTLNGAGKG